MRVWVVQFSPRFENSLELAQRHLDAADEVIFLGCDGELPACWLNPAHLASVCSKCRHVRDRGLSLLSPRLRSSSLLRLTEANKQELTALQTTFDNLDALKAYQVEGFDVGMAVASGLMTCLRDPHINVTALASWIAPLILSSVAVYRSMQNHLAEEPPDCVYVPNGRGCELRAVLRACQSKNIQCLVWESGKDKDHYDLYENAMPHDISYNQQRVRQVWEQAADSSTRETIASQWYENRAAGLDTDYVSLVKHQTAGRLPERFNPEAHNVVIFNSSEDEFAAIGDEYKNPIYDDQTDALRTICRGMAHESSNLYIYLRIHPFLRGVHNASHRSLLELKAPRFVVIPADEPISTYALMRACQTVVTFGSTTGIEAVYWGKPSVCAGMSVYRDLGGTYNPTSHEELMTAIRQPLSPRPREPALMYGYYMATHGYLFKYYQRDRFPTTHFALDGSFKGQRLDVGPWTHYFWAGVNRLPWLSRWLDARHRRKSLRVLTGMSAGSVCCK
jgi:hypothetical protein